MSQLFARYYDLIYADKDYAKDVADFASLAGRPLAGLRILELGAGTGKQSLRLASAGARVLALEIDPDFAAVLERNVAGEPQIRLSRARIEQLEPERFEAAAAFFHILNYLSPRDLGPFFSGVAQHLAPGAPFITDLWHAEAALDEPPRTETRQKRVGETKITQVIRPQMNAAARTVQLDYDFTLEGPEGRVRFPETLGLYLWTELELSQALAKAGFRDVEFFDYRDCRMPAARQSWRIWLRARRKEDKS